MIYIVKGLAFESTGVQKGVGKNIELIVDMS